MRLFTGVAPILPASDPGAAAAAESATARSLLCDLLKEADYADALLQKEESGRPYFPALPHVAVSLSHTHTHALVALLVGAPDDRPRVGIDAEPLHALSAEKASRLAARFFTAGERAYVQNAPHPVIAFLEIFTRKEAFGKYEGTGLGKNLAVDTADPNFAAAHGITMQTQITDGLCVSLCLPAAGVEHPRGKILAD